MAKLDRRTACDCVEGGSSVISFMPYLFGCLMFMSFFVELGTYIYINVAVDNAAFHATHELTQDIETTKGDIAEIVANSSPALRSGGTIEVNKIVRSVTSSSYDHHLPAQRVIDERSGNWQTRHGSQAPYNICSVSVQYTYRPRTALGYGLSGVTGGDIVVSAAYTGLADATLAGDGETSQW